MSQAPIGQAKLSWVLLMAWRDMRSAKRKLGLFALAVVAGIAALVAVNSFRSNLEDEMDRQSRSLLGADVEYESRAPFTPEMEALIGQVPVADQARSIEFSTMAYFPTVDDSRLVMVHGMEGRFPWYGELSTRPAGLEVASQEEPVALVEDGIMIQFGLSVGDPIKVGETTFTVIGELLRMPGQGSFSGTFAPRVLIPFSTVSETGLARFGSRLEHKIFQQFDPQSAEQAARVLGELRPAMRDLELDVDTVEDQRRQMARTLDGMNSFLSMIGFVALLLGGVAIAGAVQVYLKAKSETVATLRCMGASAGRAMAIYCIQISCVGLIGSVAGAIVGVSIQSALPSLMGAFLPIDLPVRISWRSVLESLAFGWVFTSLFAFLPLLPLRRISPLRAIRASVETGEKAWRDWALILVVGCLVLLSALFALNQTQNGLQALQFFSGMATAIAALAGVGMLLRVVLRRLSIGSLPYVWRHGLANLYRPNNRTTILVVTLGMGAFLIYTIYVSEQSMMRQGDFAGREGQPNIIFFDIQPDQVDGVSEVVNSLGLEVGHPEPIVTMRLQSLRGREMEEVREDPDRPIERWATRREYRSTYRDFLKPEEELVEGTFVSEATLESGQPIPISVEARVVEALSLQIGDSMVWDVQGLPVETVVASIRKVDWREMRPNFFVVFPAGVLEEAPAFFISSTRAPDRETLVALQSGVVQRFPNVSAVNLTMVLETLQGIFDKVGFVIRFMASFTIATGLVALMASVLTSRYQRARESAVLRAIGASSKQIRRIMGVEYILVGAIAGLAGVSLSLAAGWALTRFVFRVPLHIPWDATALTIALVAALTLATGMLNSLGLASRSPMEAIRGENG